ncbi:MAG: hypothetical protein V4693_13970 [Pseudomonadota bacterium]
MKQMLNDMARLLLATAAARADMVVRRLAEARLGGKEAHRANAGGWK